MTVDSGYRLSTGVRARRENFGLLFYNSNDTNLTFIRSGELLHIEIAPENRYQLIANYRNSIEREKITRLIKVLLEKGLVVETRIGV